MAVRTPILKPTRSFRRPVVRPGLRSVSSRREASGIYDLGEMRRGAHRLVDGRRGREPASCRRSDTQIAVERDRHVVIAANAVLDGLRFLRAMQEGLPGINMFGFVKVAGCARLDWEQLQDRPGRALAGARFTQGFCDLGQSCFDGAPSFRMV